jgi:hypothetical protein
MGFSAILLCSLKIYSTKSFCNLPKFKDGIRIRPERPGKSDSAINHSGSTQNCLDPQPDAKSDPLVNTDAPNISTLINDG